MSKRFQDRCDVAAGDKIGDSVERRGIAIDDHEPRPVPFRQTRQLRCGTDDERGANGQKQIAGQRLFERPPQGHRGIACPKEIVAAFTTPPQAHKGARPERSNSSRKSISSCLASHVRQTA